jgi:hypothetical protein
VARTAVPDVVSRNTVLSARQWRARGISPPLLRSLVRSGELIRMRQGVYATKRAADWAGADPVRAHALKVLAAMATAGGTGTGTGAGETRATGGASGNAVASYHSAALLHHLSLLTPPSPATVTLTLPPARRWNRAKPADVVFHASELPQEHVTRLYNLPVTTVARTVADLARTLPFMDAVVVADSALNQEKTSKPEILRVLEKCNGWPGVRQGRRALEFADERAESPLESAARVVFAEAGLDPPELQVTIHGERAQFAARVDFLWRAQKVIAEADGLVKYNDRKDLLNERERDHQLREAGYIAVHFTWRELFRTPEEVTTRLRNALAATAKT